MRNTHTEAAFESSGEPGAGTQESESLLFCFQRGGKKLNFELFAFLLAPGSRVSRSGAGGVWQPEFLGLDLALLDIGCAWGQLQVLCTHLPGLPGLLQGMPTARSC